MPLFFVLVLCPSVVELKVCVAVLCHFAILRLLSHFSWFRSFYCLVTMGFYGVTWPIRSVNQSFWSHFHTCTGVLKCSRAVPDGSAGSVWTQTYAVFALDSFWRFFIWPPPIKIDEKDQQARQRANEAANLLENLLRVCDWARVWAAASLDTFSSNDINTTRSLIYYSHLVVMKWQRLPGCNSCIMSWFLQSPAVKHNCKKSPNQIGTFSWKSLMLMCENSLIPTSPPLLFTSGRTRASPGNFAGSTVSIWVQVCMRDSTKMRMHLKNGSIWPLMVKTSTGYL